MLRPVNGVTCEVITSCGLHKFQARNPFYWPRAVDFLTIRPLQCDLHSRNQREAEKEENQIVEYVRKCWRETAKGV